MSELLLQDREKLELSEADFDSESAMALCRDHGSKFDVEWPSPMNGNKYVIHSKGYVGSIPLSDGRTIRIDPGIPIENLFGMLEYAYNLKSFTFFDGPLQVDTIEQLFERLAAILAKRVLDRLRKGIFRDYVSEEDSLAYLRGRVLVGESFKNIIQGVPRLRCAYKEYTPDLDENRILVWTLYLLTQHQFKREEVRRLVVTAYRQLSNVVPVTGVNIKDCVNRFYHKLNEDYRSMHSLCRFFLENCGPSIKFGGHEFIPFIVYMPALFESFVNEWLKTHAPPTIIVRSQYQVDLKGTDTLTFRIDIVLIDRVSGNTVAVLDTKYKRDQKPTQDDISQIAFYATSMKTNNAFLVYPSNITNLVSYPAATMTIRSLIFNIESNLDQSGRLFMSELNKVFV